MKIILTSNPNYQNYSIEAGKADNQKHFDHHGEFEKYPSPCNNEAIQPIADLENAVIEITHIDADTFCGIRRLLGMNLPKVDLNLMEKIDNNGSSVVTDKFNKTLLYMVSIGKIQRDLHFPRVSEETQDVTEIVKSMLDYTEEKIIEIGKTTQESAEKAYKNCLVEKKGEKILFSIDAKDNLDPSRAYEDGFNIVVVYRKHWKTISIYCSPKSRYSFGGSTIAGIEFGGHPKACGSPRGQEMTVAHAKKVFRSNITLDDARKELLYRTYPNNVCDDIDYQATVQKIEKIIGYSPLIDVLKTFTDDDITAYMKEIGCIHMGYNYSNGLLVTHLYNAVINKGIKLSQKNIGLLGRIIIKAVTGDIGCDLKRGNHSSIFSKLIPYATRMKFWNKDKHFGFTEKGQYVTTRYIDTKDLYTNFTQALNLCGNQYMLIQDTVQGERGKVTRGIVF